MTIKEKYEELLQNPQLHNGALTLQVTAPWGKYVAIRGSAKAMTEEHGAAILLRFSYRQKK